MTRAQIGVLALDLGTSSVRAVVYDQRGRLVDPTFAEVPYQRPTGCYFPASFWPANLRWLKATRPVAFGKTVRWVLLAEYLYGRFFGTAPVSLSIASGTGLLDVHRCRWDAQALRLAGIRGTALSPIADWDTPSTGLRPAYARRWPRLADLPWYLPLGDGALSNVGAG